MLLQQVPARKPLNPSLWKDNNLIREDVKQEINNVLDMFFEHLGLPEMEVIDVVISGACATKQWSETCPLNLYLVIDNNQVTRKYGPNADKYIASTIRTWNESQQTVINKHVVNMFVLDEDQPRLYAPTYSVKEQEWLIEP